MNFQMARRRPGAAIIVPSVAHWKVGHFAAISKKVDDRYLIQDPTFGEDLVVARETLDRESRGYFLVPAGSLPDGWQVVSADEGDKVWGRGDTGSNHDPGATGSNEVKSDPDPPCGGESNPPLTRYNIHASVVSLTLTDTPVGYTPQVGPPVLFQMFYAQRDAEQPANFAYSNFGPKWTSNWISYVTDNTASNGTASVYGRGGGLETYTFPSGSSVSNPGPFSQAQLTKTTGGGGVTTGFVRQLRDGSSETFQKAFGTNQYFLTAITDAAGNSVSLAYDSSMRITMLTDAIGQTTTITYGLASDPLKITKVTDPFGRFASFGYNASGDLASITDKLGLVSSYTYGPGDFVNTLTTPYGATTFTYGDSSTDPNLGPTRFVTATDPLGQTERIEFGQNNSAINFSDSVVPNGVSTFNSYLNFRNTYVWDKHALPLATAGGSIDYTKARILHWLHTADGQSTSRVLESTKNPLENRVWFNYPGQPAPLYVGTSNQPSAIARVLDDGTTQLRTFQYNALGNVTQSTDPVGRQRTFGYAANGLDLTSASDTTGGRNDLLFSATYNTQHEPLTVTDAAGQTTSFTYASNGQALSSADPTGTTNFTYDANKRLSQITRNPGSSVMLTLSYDAANRVLTATDTLGYRLTYTYDAADRITKITYPDGGATTDQFVYQLLDLSSFTDRLSHTTHYTHNANRQLTEIDDPLNRATTFTYCDCGVISGITDGNNHTTTFLHDLQDRLVGKQFADGTSIAIAYENTTSRVRTKTDALSQVTQFSYNKDDTPGTITYANALHPTPNVSFTWDPDFERLDSMQDGIGTTTFNYNPVSNPPALGATRLATITGPIAGAVVEFQYDRLGRVTQRSINGVNTTQNFDQLGRVFSIQNALGTFNVAYQGASALVSMVSGAGPSRAFSYDTQERLTNINNTAGASSISQFNYTYDAESRAITESGTSPSYSRQYTYDNANELLSAGATPGSAPTYSYDSVGNLTAQGESQTQFTFNSVNAIASVAGSRQFASPQYDASGNPVSLDDDSTFTVPRQLEWDGAGRLTAIVSQ
jgi:YD repeat-containing protein